MVGALRRLHPDANIVHLSDLDTPAIEGTVTIRRACDNPKRILYFRYQCYAALPIMQPTWFLDTDMLPIKVLNAKRALGKHDVGVCLREFENDWLLLPYIAEKWGADVAKHVGKPMGEVHPYLACCTITRNPSFWEQCLAWMEWAHEWHDQDALKHMVNHSAFTFSKLKETVYACPTELEADHSPKMLHFKGPIRKQLMPIRAQTRWPLVKVA